jgi:hypothetical protein
MQQLMFVDVTAEENKCKWSKKEPNKSEIEPVSARSAVQMTMTTIDPNWGVCPPTGHTVCFTKHTSPACIRYHLLLVAYYEAACGKTRLLFPSILIFLFLEGYYIVLHCSSTFFYSFISPRPKFCHRSRQSSLPGG